ncbi:unknown [Candidatus Colimorpha enterica]|uniref:Gram-positive cocci surface proteins LPxTG domain-containing protein n=1 Tax=Candidatus Colimorpha enterica TaxID=3083063 RepID=R6TLG4_9BACT|nr:unknown [Candidatus Colimorpha enterica]
MTVDKDGNITVTFTDGSTHKAGSIPVSKEEVQALKTMAGAAAGVAGLLAGMGYVLLKRKKQV